MISSKMDSISLRKRGCMSIRDRSRGAPVQNDPRPSLKQLLEVGASKGVHATSHTQVEKVLNIIKQIKTLKDEIIKTNDQEEKDQKNEEIQRLQNSISSVLPNPKTIPSDQSTVKESLSNMFGSTNKTP